MTAIDEIHLVIAPIIVERGELRRLAIVDPSRNVAFRPWQRGGQTLSIGANTLLNARSAQCPADSSTEIPMRIYAK
jgi:hypothetical protein